MDDYAKEAQEKSVFKLYQPVRVRRSGGLSLVNGMHEIPRPEDDPNLYFDSRVVGWDMFGRIEVATIITDNVHCTEWCWSEDKLQAQPAGKWDWYQDRMAGLAAGKDGYWDKNRFWQEVGSEIYFMWELTTKFCGDDNYTLGETVKAVLVGPHINHGDWIVSYEKKPKDMWITRVLNERQMWPRE
jgi:hypothetical protein